MAHHRQMVELVPFILDFSNIENKQFLILFAQQKTEPIVDNVGSEFRELRLQFRVKKPVRTLLFLKFLYRPILNRHTFLR